MTRQRRTIPIREELLSLTAARREMARLRLPDTFLPKHRDDAARELSVEEREQIEWDLDPETSRWSPFEVNDVASKEQLFTYLEQYMHDTFMYFNRTDRSFCYIPGASLDLVKVFTDPRGINPPEYRLLLDDEKRNILHQAFSRRNKARIVTWIVVGSQDRPEFRIACVFYRKFDPSALVVELYNPNLSQMNDHPAFEELNDQIIRLLRHLDVATIPSDVLIGLLDSDVTSDECMSYLPFLNRYNTVPDYMFGYLWNAFLFIDRVQEPLYTMKEIQQIMYKFSLIDVDTRKKVYLAFLEFIARFRYYLYFTMPHP